MADPKTQSSSWADEVDDEYEDCFLEGSPARTETDVDEQGIKTIVDVVYRDGVPYKVTKRVRVVKRLVRVNKNTEERKRNWKKFGKAVSADATQITIPEAEIPFHLTGQTKQSLVDRKAVQNELNKLLMEGSYKAPTKATSTTNDPTQGGDAKPAEAPKTNAYVPPSQRNGRDGKGQSMRSDDGPTLRVSNLSQAISEQDLRELFINFGPLHRVKLVTDRQTGESKGFGFVSYHRRDDAEKAMKSVSGFGYDHLILQVEWARPLGN